MGEALTVHVDGAAPLSAAAVEAVRTFCDQAEDRGGSGLATVYVTGTPAGGWTRGLDVSLVNKWERALRRLERLPLATVAVARGDCGGTALDALLAADIRVATPDTQLRVVDGGAGTWPGMAGYRLVQLAGVARIRRAVLFGLPVDAAEALALGLVDEVATDPAAAVAAAAGLVSGRSGRELAIRRQLLFDARTTSFEDALGPHLAACDRTLRGAADQKDRAS
ncbi:enoyl-CoA hydratase/isomerase family protein [Streptomyces sp. A7024]|uniref:Enoyl-CoA hydratase/isomerase family protein n=1 Tax=Streptomyces coryli TaxID=1128680 RepID=A0A6G4U342_9ACTN|nr:enoyl-CoA hydratase/isomerase family protein [Streptomyces coryli]